ncbi:MAG: hypothetical protein Q7S45_03040 [Candidatus Curtissbacteria bacterium]|nr:hypothetical protein [Candidatus Curtissbacteria bacterium]
MDFSYTIVTDWPNHQVRQRYLPWINIGIKKPGKEDTIWPLGLVDSGAEITILDREIGEELGFNFKKAARDIITGFGGGKVEVFLLQAEFVIDDNSGKEPIIYKDLLGFTKGQFPQTHPQQTAIFGTIGLFRNAQVNFRYPTNIHIEQFKAK